MKKVFALILAVTMALSFAACTKGGDADTETSTSAVTVENALEILTEVWGTYTDDEKFAVSGGDVDNIVNDAPGKYSIENVEALDSALGVPQANASMIDDAASLMHMMNANTFTCGAFHVTDAANVQAFEDALKTNIMGRQWMCGFPDTLIIATVGGDYVVSAFGNAEIIETFKTKLTAQYGTDATVVYEESLAF